MDYIENLKSIKAKLTNLNSHIASSFSKFLKKFEFINPNIISFSGFIIAGIIGSFFILMKFYTLSSFIILFGFWLDSVDGNFARSNNMATVKGAILDSVLDRYTDLMILSAIIIANRNYLILGLIAMIGSSLIPYIRARVEGAGFKAAGTFCSREIRCLIIIIGLMFHLIFLMLITLAILTNISAIHRLYNSLKQIEK